MGLTPQSQAFQTEMRALLQWRQHSSAVAKGRLIHFVPEGGAYVYFRDSEEETIMVVLNKSEASMVLNLDRFDEVLQGRRDLVNALDPTDTSEGQELLVPSWGARVYVVE